MTDGQRPQRGFWPLRDVPVVLWLAATAAVAVVHPFVPAPRWLMIHLLLLGAVTHAILVWSRHFADALLHTPPRPGDRRAQSARLLLLNGGVAAVLVGVVAGTWPLTAVGAASVATAVLGHGVALLGQLRRALPARFAPTVHYYVAAAGLLPVGLVLGTLLARGLGDPLHERVLVAHVAVNVLGWMGLTVVGTLLTLWPTMLRTRMVPGAERAARRALPLLVAAVLVAATGSLVGARPLVGVGLLGYVVALVVVARPFVATARAKPPSSYPTWSVLAAVTWLVGAVVVWGAAVVTAPSWHGVEGRFAAVTPALAAGFGAQVLLGALSYLVPVVLGGGPSPVRAANDVLARGGALRIVLVNGGLLVAVLPVPGAVRVLAATLVLVGLGAFLPLLFLAMRASRRAKAAPGDRRTTAAAAAAADPAQRGRNVGLAASGLAAVVLAVAVGVAVDPAALGTADVRSAAAGVAPTGEVTRVTVRAEHMRFVPSTIDVPAGNRLEIEVVNADEHGDVHDLTLETGAHTDRLAGGESATLEVPVVGRDLEGWCSVVGHRQMGMVLQVHVTGTDPAAADAMSGHAMSDGSASHSSDAADDLDFSATPPADFVARDATLAPAPGGRVHRRTLHVRDTVRDVAPGVSQELWTYGGSAPGPVLHGRVGDVFEITVVNDGDTGHSIDFHAGELAPDGPMRTLAPGESLVYRFRATRAGIWMYHCSTMPMSAHIANGMFGAVVIEPRGLPPVDRSYVLIQSELYLGPQGGVADVEKIRAERPDAVVFNGYVDQYDARPLAARTGERVRVWVLDAGPNRPTSFHVVGAQFDTVWSEGAYLLRHGQGGSQALALAPGQGGFVELAFPEPGDYPFVSHLMVDAERGAHGVFRVVR
ncbi:MAG TPA: multicopper oxidase domain-containing protein [Nocardioides sp.]|nr:multicopper oxidase domain-containing protein [Nocardioides sp.]